MNFLEISQTFEKLENTSKRLEKILILRDFLIKNPKVTPLIFDIISGNFQRENNKKSVGISLKTIFSIINFISKKTEKEIEKEFNKVGDIGQLAETFLSGEIQSSLLTKDLTLLQITQAFEKISSTSGTNSNKIKKEILGNLFLNAKENLERKFLARLLIDDLRIGVSEGVLKEACVNTIFPKIIGIHQLCSKCFYINLNSKTCSNCHEDILTKAEPEQFENRFKIVEIGTPKEIIGLDNFIGETKSEETIKFALRLNPKTHIIQTTEPRAFYKLFSELFEKKYNTLNSFTDTLFELKKDLQKVLKVNIKYFRPIKSMLGVRSNTVKDSFEVSGIPAVLDYKYDGLRVQIHADNGQIQLFSRNLDNITKQFPEIIKFIQTNFPKKSFVMDSETVGYDYNTQKYLPFQMLSKRILSKNINEVNHIKVVVKAFDLLKLENKTLIDEPYEKRREILENLFVQTPIREKIKFDLELLKNL